MRSHALAQALLGVFARPESASAITGDLIEQSHGRVDFYLSAICVAASLCLRAVAGAPLKAAVWAIASYFVWCVTYLAALYLTGALGAFPFYPGYVELGIVAAPMSFWIRFALAISSASLLTGIIASRMSPGGTAVAPLVVLWLLAWLTWPFQAIGILGIAWPWVLVGAVALPILGMVPLLVGAIVGRRHRIA
jgi:hypothetical protein